MTRPKSSSHPICVTQAAKPSFHWSVELPDVALEIAAGNTEKLETTLRLHSAHDSTLAPHKNCGVDPQEPPRIPQRHTTAGRVLRAVPVACCVRGVRFCLHSAFNQRYESVGAKFVAEKLISLAPSHNGFRSPFERFAARGAHTVCGGWMRLTVHAFVLPPKEDKHFPAK
jgi:hypothetical protein